MSVVQHAKANPIFQAAANHSSPFRPPPYLTFVAIHLLRYVYLMGIATPHRLGTAVHPCEGHGMAIESYSVLAFSPCATAKNLLPDATPHNPLPRIRSSVTFMLEQLSCAPHWSC
jgi:hypothetical protein